MTQVMSPPLRFCSNCGGRREPGARFCPGCGVPLDGRVVGDVVPVAASGPADPLAAFGEHLRSVPWADLVPLRSWWADGGWRRGWVGLFGLFAVSPFVLLRATSGSDNVKAVAWGFSVYFAVMWMIAIFALVRPERVEVWRLVRIALFTSVAGVAIALLLERHLAPQDGAGLFRMIVGVGFPEELAKAAAVYLFIFRRPGAGSTRVFLFAGAVSGLAFGAAEAVAYSTSYAQLAPYLTTSSYTSMEVWRLLTDSLFHACIAGIGAYFIGLAYASRASRAVLIAAGLAVTSVLHGAYDTFADSWAGTALAALIVFVFIGYVRSGDAIARRLAASAQ